MKNPFRWNLILIAVVVFLACTSGKPVQQGGIDGSVYFSETGFSISGPFLEMYNSADDPLVIFGFPISDIQDHSITPNVKVQYFQRARMEYDPSRPEGQQVTLTNLGEFLYDEANSREDANIFTSNAACRFFNETQYPVCYLFLQYYQANQGEKFFGLPISEVRVIDGRLVQYFEWARMEWRPENLPGRRVQLTDLGQLYLYIQGGSEPVFNPATGKPQLTKAYVRIFPSKPLVGPNETQTVFIVVQDQLMRPYPGAQVSVSLEYPDGTSLSSERLESTNEYGITQMNNISTAGVGPNQFVKIVVEVKTSQDEPAITATSWFRVWW